MAHRSVALSFLVLVASVVQVMSPRLSLALAPIEGGLAQVNCEDAFARLTQDEDWFDQLADPVLTTREQISGRADLYSEVYGCLSYAPDALSDRLEAIRVLLEYFLIFVGGGEAPGDASALHLIDLAASNDPGIVQIRDVVGLKPPNGYIFVRFYPSREAMPDLLRRAFRDKDVKGVTILVRYVAVLAEDEITWPEHALQAQTLPKTITHELVHAYVNSTLGIQDSGVLPKWFHEGIAIYFSGSGEDHVVVTPDGFAISKTLPEDYQQYDLNFKYLEAKLGRERLLELIRQSIEEVDIAVLYGELGIASDQQLVASARAWKEQRDLFKISVGIVVASAVLLGLYNLMPQVRCLWCDYAGKKRDFEDGLCPECGMPFLEM